MALVSKRISAVGTMQVAPAGHPELWTINVNTGGTSSVLTVYNATSATGTPVAIIDCSSKSSHAYGIVMPLGIFVEMTGGNSDVTIGHT